MKKKRLVKAYRTDKAKIRSAFQETVEAFETESESAHAARMRMLKRHNSNHTSATPEEARQKMIDKREGRT